MALHFYEATIQPVLSLVVGGTYMGHLKIHLGNTSEFQVHRLYDAEEGYVRDANVRARILTTKGEEVDYGVLTLEYVDGSQGDYRAEISSLLSPPLGDYRMEIVAKMGAKVLTKILTLTIAAPPTH